MKLYTVGKKPSRQGGYEGHDYNGIVSQLNLDAQKDAETSKHNKYKSEAAKVRREAQKLKKQ